MRVENMTTTAGNKVANQFVVHTDEGRFFQSYDSMIAFIPKDGGPIQLGADWDYSVTTGRYRNQFLNCDKAQILEMLEDGRAVLNPEL